MTKSKKRTFIAITLGSLLGLGAFGLAMSSQAEAQPRRGGPGAGGPGHHGPPNGERCLPKHIKEQLPLYDTNKNGKLDRVERRALRATKRSAAHAEFDVNKDGKLDKTERTNLRHAKMVEFFEALDQNQNAEISKAEATGSCSPIEWGFERVDADANGSITWAEFEKAAHKGRGGMRGKQGKMHKGKRGKQGKRSMR